MSRSDDWPYMVAPFPGGDPVRARLTTEHASSSYGKPVLELETGEALGVREAAAYRLTTEPGALALALLDRAGYGALAISWV